MKQQLITTRVKSRGFTLPELMIAAALGVGLAIVAGEAMRAHLQSNAKVESIQRQREDWNRTTSFLESEIAMSGRILTNPAGVSIPPQCDLTPTELKLALDLSVICRLCCTGFELLRIFQQQNAPNGWEKD